MSPEEYTNLEHVEKNHWYYVGKRQIVRHWLQSTCGINPSLRLLDCGAGTGSFAVEILHEADISVMDDHEESLQILRKRFSPNAVIEGGCTAIPFPDNSFDAVTALDVLEHIPDHAAAAAEMIRILKPGGTIVITVPAMMSLWSDWDVSLHHVRRYDKSSLLDLFQGDAVSVAHCNYINVVALPLVWASRKARILGIGKGTRAEDRIPPRLLNHALREFFVRLGCSRLSFPFGVGLILVAKKSVK